jgi:hypothetical protein
MASKALAEVDETKNQIAVYKELEDYAAEGFSEVKTEDLAIPFLRILAQLSPQVDKRNGAYVEGAEAGMIFNTVLNEVYSGEQGIQVIPVHYNRRFVEWTPREKGGGYAGSYETTDPIVTTVVRNERGEDLLPNGNLLANTAQFFVLYEHPTQGLQRAMIPMTSTQLKKSRKWLTQMQSLTASGANGIYTLPMMSQVYCLTTVAERNDKGNWFGWEITRAHSINLELPEGKASFETAVAFARSVKAGDIQVRVEQPTDPDEQDNSII